MRKDTIAYAHLLPQREWLFISHYHLIMTSYTTHTYVI